MAEIAVILHLFNLDLLPEFQGYLRNLDQAAYAYDLYVAVPFDIELEPLRVIWPRAMLIPYENRGFDIASFFTLSALALQHRNYTMLLKLHTKTLSSWRKAVIEPLCGSTDAVRKCVALFADPNIGMVGAQKWLLPMGRSWGIYAPHIQSICSLWNVPLRDCQFIGGTMFWLRASVLRTALEHVPLEQAIATFNTETSLDYPWYVLNYPDLPRHGIDSEAKALAHWKKNGKLENRACNIIYARHHNIPVLIDGMIEHAYERFLGLLVRSQNYSVRGV